jgi:short-subunit dehydrogenase
MSNNYFTNKKVWITGASSGIGASLSKELVKRGAYVILSARDGAKLEAIKEALSDPAKAEIVALDMMSGDSLEQATKQVIERHPDLFMLMNNAGKSQRSKVEETKMEVYRDLMELNYFGVIHLTKLVLPTLIRNNAGHIMATSSVAGKLGAPYRSGYAASKHALHGFFDCLRSEVAHHGIAVTLVCPGFVNTPIAHNAYAGNGEALGKADPENANGMDPDELAVKICNALAGRKEEVNFGGKEILAIYIKRFFPKLLSKMLKNRSKKEFGA